MTSQRSGSSPASSIASALSTAHAPTSSRHHRGAVGPAATRIEVLEPAGHPWAVGTSANAAPSSQRLAPVSQATLELGRVQKTIFVARYLRDRDLQREINEGLNRAQPCASAAVLMGSPPRSITAGKIHGRRDDPMTVSSVEANGSVWSAQPLAPRTPPPINSTDELLGGLSTSELSQSLRPGDTMTSLASERGALSDSLAETVESGPTAGALHGAPPPPADPLSPVTSDMANRTPPAGHDDDPTGGTPPAGAGHGQGAIVLNGPTSVRAESNLSSMASALGTDPSTLLEQLSAGRDLSSLLPAGARAPYGPPPLNSNGGGILVDQYA